MAKNTPATPWYADGLRFECTGCGDCCTGSPGYVWVTQKEIDALAEELKITPAACEKKYVRNRRHPPQPHRATHQLRLHLPRRPNPQVPSLRSSPPPMQNLALLEIDRPQQRNLARNLRRLPRQRNRKTVSARADQRAGGRSFGVNDKPAQFGTLYRLSQVCSLTQPITLTAGLPHVGLAIAS